MKTKNLICGLCKKKINTKEKYVHVEDWDNNKKISEIWCHLKCFQKSMNKNEKEIMSLAKASLLRINSIFDNLFPSTKKNIVEIK